jgi:hypothetical protein
MRSGRYAADATLVLGWGGLHGKRFQRLSLSLGSPTRSPRPLPRLRVILPCHGLALAPSLDPTHSTPNHPYPTAHPYPSMRLPAPPAHRPASPQILESEEPDYLVYSYPIVDDDSKPALADDQFVSPQVTVLQAPTPYEYDF